MFAKKSLGQHFLRCEWVSKTLIHAAEVNKNDFVIEIGPGEGALTELLSRGAGRVLAIEKDERLAQKLVEKLKGRGIKNVEVRTGDILHFLAEEKENPRFTRNPYKTVANIPYYLTARLLRALFSLPQKPEAVSFTLQKEVAERITAKPPHTTLLSLSIQIFGTPQKIKTVPPECFSPRPKVESAVISIKDISSDALRASGVSEETFFAIARALFRSPRKTIENNLRSVFEKEAVKRLLSSAGISHNKRAGELSLNDFLTLAKLFTNIA